MPVRADRFTRTVRAENQSIVMAEGSFIPVRADRFTRAIVGGRLAHTREGGFVCLYPVTLLLETAVATNFSCPALSPSFW